MQDSLYPDISRHVAAAPWRGRRVNHLKGTFKPSEGKQGKACPRGPRLPTLSYSASRLTCFLLASLCLCPSLSVPLSLFPSHLGFPLGSGSSLTLPRGPRGIAGSRGHQQERGPHGVTASTQCGPSGATPTSPPIDSGDLLGFLCHCCAGPWGGKRVRTGVVGAEGVWV